MEKIFENKCIYTYDYYLQLKKKTMNKGFNNTCYGAMIFALIFGGITLSNQWYSMFIVACALFIFFCYRLFGTPIRLASFAARKNREIHGKDVNTSNVFYDDHLLAINANSGGKTIINYVDVLNILETKNLYIIGMEGGLVLMLDKNGFTKGTREDFIVFISEKCINANVQI